MYRFWSASSPGMTVTVTPHSTPRSLRRFAVIASRAPPSRPPATSPRVARHRSSAAMNRAACSLGASNTGRSAATVDSSALAAPWAPRHRSRCSPTCPRPARCCGRTRPAHRRVDGGRGAGGHGSVPSDSAAPSRPGGLPLPRSDAMTSPSVSIPSTTRAIDSRPGARCRCPPHPLSALPQRVARIPAPARDRLDPADDPRDRIGRLGRRGRQPPHLFGHDAEAAAVLAGAGRLDRRVQREQIRAVSDLVDRPAIRPTSVTRAVSSVMVAIELVADSTANSRSAITPSTSTWPLCASERASSANAAARSASRADWAATSCSAAAAARISSS